MDPTGERPQSPEIEKVPFLRIGFLGRDAGFLRINLESQMGQDKISAVYEENYRDLKKKIKQLQELGQDIPRVVVTDKISPKEAEELNSQGISIIFLDQKHGDHGYLTLDNPQRKVRNEVITVASIDSKNMEALLSLVTQAIKNLTQPK